MRGREHRRTRRRAPRGSSCPVSSSRPNSTPMNSSGAAIHAVRPSESGPPIAKPMNPAACWRAAGSCGDPAHRCHSPSAGSTIIAAPRISRGRARGRARCASARRRSRRAGSATAPPRSRSGAQEGVDPRADRPGGVEPGTRGDHHGDAEQCQRDAVAAVSGFDVAGPADRARGDPAPLASISQPARAPRPTSAPAAEIGEGFRRRGRLPAGRRGRAGRVPPREPVFDLLVRAPERAAVLLGMSVSLVAGPICTICHTGHSLVSELSLRFA